MRKSLGQKKNGLEGSHIPAPKTGAAHFFAACRYSLSGLRYAWSESAFRQELLAGCLLLPAAWLLPFPFWQSLLLSLLWLLLLIIELLNSAIEAAVDLVSPQYHPLAKKAKDLGSAAVALCISANALAWFACLLACFC